MTPRPIEERIEDVARLLAAARAVYDGRARIAPALARSTGLSLEGIELGFASLELVATPDELRALVLSAGDASHAHVILSANVFVAPLRAIALARAAAPCVTVQPSSRDPVLTEALVAATADPAIALTPPAGADTTRRVPVTVDRIDVYGRADTIRAVCAAAAEARRAQPAVVRGRGPGLGVAFVACQRDPNETLGRVAVDAADALAGDIVPFDQRGCSSPRVALVEGTHAEAAAFARALHDRLAVWGARVPRGALSEAERAESARWRDAIAFSGDLLDSGVHAVGVLPDAREALPLAVPPPGRHVLVVPVASAAEAGAAIAAVSPFVVTVGTNAPEVFARLAPIHARVSPLGRMQHPPFDGYVDRRPF
jgi:hypothetical protein